MMEQKALDYVKARIENVKDGETIEEWIQSADYEIQQQVRELLLFLMPVPNNGTVYLMEETAPLNPLSKRITLRVSKEQIFERLAEFSDFQHFCT